MHSCMIVNWLNKRK
ncbi:hypothetical protein [Escherichia coli]